VEDRLIKTVRSKGKIEEAISIKNNFRNFDFIFLIFDLYFDLPLTAYYIFYCHASLDSLIRELSGLCGIGKRLTIDD